MLRVIIRFYPNMQSAVKVWRNQQKTKNLLCRKGTILAWTELSVAPPSFDSEVPYSIVLVELENGERVYGQLVDFEDKDRMIGRSVQSVFRRMQDVMPEDVLEYGIKFKPLQ